MAFFKLKNNNHFLKRNKLIYLILIQLIKLSKLPNSIPLNQGSNPFCRIASLLPSYWFYGKKIDNVMAIDNNLKRELIMVSCYCLCDKQPKSSNLIFLWCDFIGAL